MSPSYDDQMSQIMAEFEQQRDQLFKTREEFGKATVSATSKDHLVEVTMLMSGQVKDIKFHRTDYASMPPAQLSALLVETINAALQKGSAKAQEMYRSQTSFGADLRESMIGGDEVNDVFKDLRGLFDMFETGPKKRAANDEDEF
ncbi:YbaB/EbfC family nucleoid-associated protein [Kineosporia sp. J2-2]|uniref:YbaB/EbfC family nucleoid-associated protein n=1 Tax=Kineosporia corallincola TaxID=2835133 RepID=A0ABS5TTX3_9ACTN|nr:YbaB/EbfC family nucleoid-associated protein [Kineosporia corallincola]MBT0774247.1 YbaB/EbfC family nucleoid-associated protein [Kineosporia corallincola]